MIGRTYTLIEEREESDDEETEEESQAEDGPEGAAHTNVVGRLSQEGHISGRQCRAYRGWNIEIIFLQIKFLITYQWKYYRGGDVENASKALVLYQSYETKIKLGKNYFSYFGIYSKLHSGYR